MRNNFLEKIRNKEIALGGWVNSTDPFITEIFTVAGCDWIFIDTEHEPIGRRDLMGILLACKGTDCTPLVRVPENTAENYKWVLDIGAGGIIVPQIKTADDVKKAVEYCRYYPDGERGAGALRVSGFGTNADYYKNANNNTALVIEFENIKCLDNVESILKVKGYDAVFIGPMDLAQSMGFLNQTDAPEVQKAIETIIRTLSARGIPVGITVKDKNDLLTRVSQGAGFFILGSDYRFVRDGIKAKLSESREAVK